MSWVPLVYIHLYTSSTMRCLHLRHCCATVFLLASCSHWEMTAWPVPMPAKEWRVVPPIWKAATPVLAVTKVWSGGRTWVDFKKLANWEEKVKKSSWNHPNNLLDQEALSSASTPSKEHVPTRFNGAEHISEEKMIYVHLDISEELTHSLMWRKLCLAFLGQLWIWQ